MKATTDCVACLFRQALNTSRLLTDDPAVHLRILKKVAGWVQKLSLNNSPAIISKPVYLFAASVTGMKDPYARMKKETNRAALKLVPELKKFILKADDPLDAAIHVAVAGNIIDMGIGHSFDFTRSTREILGIMKEKLAISALSGFRKELKPGRRLLYLGDNAGEIVFDRLLVEQILKTGTEITFAVKSGPIINDATMQDAATAGLTKLVKHPAASHRASWRRRVKVITTGGDDVGVDWTNVSNEFRKAVRDADVILAKGHGNFETCDDRPENFYFLLKTKCDVVARALGVKYGDIVFKHSRRTRRS